MGRSDVVDIMDKELDSNPGTSVNMRLRAELGHAV